MSLKKNLNFLLKQKWTLLIIVLILILLVLMIMSKSSKTVVTELFKKCGITINGNNPQDISVKDDRMWAMIFSNGELGLAESYMEEYWDTKDLYQTLFHICKNYDKVEKYDNYNLNDYFSYIKNKFINPQGKEIAEDNIGIHYDVGNDLYEFMLDKNMQYTCSFFQDTDNLDKAQEQKLDLIGQKLNLQPGERLLDIGCGFGGLANYLSIKYGVYVYGVTISQEQVNWAKEKYKDNKKVDINFMDYRNIPDDLVFDKVVSIGCLEHIGPSNYEEYFNVIKKHLKDKGICLVHFISRQPEFKYFDGKSAFLDKYIFPNAHTPSLKEVSNAILDKFFLIDWHNLGKHYAPTLLAWHKNINDNWDKLPRYDEKFKRMWNFYLLGIAANFNLCYISLYQILLTKGCPDKYPRRDCVIKY